MHRLVNMPEAACVSVNKGYQKQKRDFVVGFMHNILTPKSMAVFLFRGPSSLQPNPSLLTNLIYLIVFSLLRILRLLFLIWNCCCYYENVCNS